MEKTLKLATLIKLLLGLGVVVGATVAGIKATDRQVGAPSSVMEKIETHDSSIAELKKDVAVHEQAITYIREDLREVKLGVRELLRANRGPR